MLNILVIEDDNIRRSLLRLNIEKLGYDVSEAATGREGLEIITEKMPQLIILDITLPDISGLKVLEMIKENVDTLHIPVIIASGRDTDEDIVEGLDCGASDYVTKPYRWNLVNARVKAALREIEIKRLLLEAAFEAKKSNQCKNQFLANMSHEIRTPLNGILGTLQLLEHTSLSTEQQEYSRIISSSGNMLMHLLNDLLDLSKIEANEIELEATVFDIEDLVAEVAEIIYHRACDKKLKVLFSFEDEFPFKLVGDAGRIKQIILNFANNAVKFTDHGHICFGASIVIYSGQNIVCRLTVNDTGLGINDEDKKQMFRKFVLVDSSDTRK
ncbi:MAG: response regulator, partial [Lentisphaeraceae bacterium]|nr:response regulator [Lentisphaeraceae bacterium]